MKLTSQQKWSLKRAADSFAVAVDEVFGGQTDLPEYPDGALGTDGTCWKDAEIREYVSAVGIYAGNLVCRKTRRTPSDS